MATTIKHSILFQQDWTGKGERGLRDFLLIPAIFFGAVSPGLYISSILTDYTSGCWIAIIMNLIGYGITHLLFLGKMGRFWRAMLNWKTSWISRGFIFNVFFTVFGLLYTISFSLPFSFLSSPMIKSVIMILSTLSAVLFAAYPGFMLSIVKAIPFWRSILEPVIFFLQAVMGGIAIQLIIIPSDIQVITALLKMNFVLTTAVLLLLMTALIIKALHGGTEKVSVEFLTKGELSFLFIGGTLIFGLVAPLFILMTGFLCPLDFVEYRFLYYIAMFMELAGIYIGKYSILRAGAYSPLR